MTTPASSADLYGLPINQETAFSNPKGKYKERIRKQQLKMLKAYVPLLKQFLEPGEVILLAMRGCSPMSFLEQFTTGWIIYYLKRCTLVVTDRRVLHFPSKTNYSPRHSIAQIRYGDVDEIKPATFLGRKFTVRYKNGAKETFLYAKDSAKLKSILPALPTAGLRPTTIGGRHHLCPKCNAPLTPGEYACSFCRLEFKNEKKARTLSILLPGGGYFYTGHPFLGTGDAVVETMLILMVALALLNRATGADAGGVWMPQFVFFGILLFLEKLYTIYHAKHYVKEYIPVEKDFQPVKRG